MMREPRDRIAAGKTADGRLEIGRSDVCDAFEQDPDRLFSVRECWYCKYGNFGIHTENPTEIGVCKNKKCHGVRRQEQKSLLFCKDL